MRFRTFDLAALDLIIHRVFQGLTHEALECKLKIWREIAPKRFDSKLCECVYFGAVSIDPELVGVAGAVAGSQRIRHLVTKSCVLGLSPGNKEDADNCKLKG